MESCEVRCPIGGRARGLPVLPAAQRAFRGQTGQHASCPATASSSSSSPSNRCLSPRSPLLLPENRLAPLDQRHTQSALQTVACVVLDKQMIPCLKTRRALLRRVLYVSAMRARLTARAKPSSLWILPHRNRALETSQKICLSAPAFPCHARESKSCQVQYPQRLRPRCPPSSASVRDCTAMSSLTQAVGDGFLDLRISEVNPNEIEIDPRLMKRRECTFSLRGREEAELHTCWSGQTACTWPQHAAPPALSNSRPQGQWAFTTPVALALESLRRQGGEPSCIPIFKNQRSPRLCEKLAGPEYLRRTTQRAKQPNSMLPGGVRRVPSRQMPRGKP